MATNHLIWKIGGIAGSGLVVSGRIFAKACSRAGLRVFEKRSFHSNIKGLHTWTSIRVAEEDAYCQEEGVDILVALDSETVQKHTKHLSKGSAVIYDPEKVEVDKSLEKEGILLCPVPLVKIATEDGGKEIMMNTVALGASFGISDFPLDTVEDAIKSTFSGKKGEKIAKANIEVARKGYEYAKEKFPKFDKDLKPRKGEPERIFISGNDAIAFGAIQAGCKFISAYPMTPATSILMTLAKHEKDADMIVKQVEDELAALLTAAGAAHAGVRAMTSTSGGGFALMNEGFGMVASTETPLVVVVVQRPGPSSGLPTRTSQGDLKHLVNAAPGETPRIVLAPGDWKECFYKTAEAFNLAEKYQLPVMIISDKYLGMNYKNLSPFDTSKVKIERGKLIEEPEANKLKDYKRYALTDDGVSPRVIPGKGPTHISSSYVVDEAGDIDETSENAVKMLDKLYNKIPHILKDLEPPKLIGPKDADITLVSWGSTKGPILYAMKLLEKEGIKVNFLQIMYIVPFQREEISKILKDSKKTICIENNKTGQLADIISGQTGILVNHKVNKYDGRQFYPKEIVEEVKKIANG